MPGRRLGGFLSALGHGRRGSVATGRVQGQPPRSVCAAKSADQAGRRRGHPKLDASWKGFALEQILLLAGERNAHYWATQGHAELDQLLQVNGRRLEVEIKYRDAPTLTKSMQVAFADLRLQRLYVVHPGDARYRCTSAWRRCRWARCSRKSGRCGNARAEHRHRRNGAARANSA